MYYDNAKKLMKILKLIKLVFDWNVGELMVRRPCLGHVISVSRI